MLSSPPKGVGFSHLACNKNVDISNKICLNTPKNGDCYNRKWYSKKEKGRY